ncbi:MAG: IclR family transcriptional regulator [Proteobacteria bacterium]|nr:IclR family transcriptional regulator [Pseudomonadota bacterium]
MDKTEARHRQRGIQSVEVGGALLKVLVAAEGALTLGEIARRAGLTPAKAHPYLVSYGCLGLIVQDRQTGRYDVGPLALQAGLAALRRLNPLRVADEGLAALVEESSQMVAIAVWAMHGATIVRIEESPRPLHVNLRVGSVMSLRNTATGNVFAAYLRPADIADALQREGMPGTPTIGASAGTDDALQSLVSGVRAVGLASTIDHPIPGISALSAPVFDHRGALAMAITLLGPSGTFDAAVDGDLAGMLQRYARSVTARLGGAVS